MKSTGQLARDNIVVGALKVVLLQSSTTSRRVNSRQHLHFTGTRNILAPDLSIC